ncbi:MAG: hypothetical protein CMJ58_02325 [Planctomycetaceae bacterium]|nr:hypothetical protein [Planctomycetaceae bacterium]
MTRERPKYRYRVDARDVIVSVDSWWLAFARENGAPELTAERVVGRSLWDYVEGGEVQRTYRALHDRIRATKTCAAASYRCDSPTLRRDMQLTITPSTDGCLQYESVIVRVTPAPYVGLFDAVRPRSKSVLTVCSHCRRALLEPHGWLDPDAVSDRLQRASRWRWPQIRHVLCPNCSKSLGAVPAGPAAAAD